MTKREYIAPVIFIVIISVLNYAALPGDGSHVQAKSGIPPYFDTNESAGDTIWWITHGVFLPIFLIVLCCSREFTHAAYLVAAQFIQSCFVAYIKYYTGALKPDGKSYGSFVSGHTASAASCCYYMLCVAAFYRLPERPLWCLCCIVLLIAYPWYVSVSRIINNEHYAADVVGSHILALTISGALFVVALPT